MNNCSDIYYSFVKSATLYCSHFCFARMTYCLCLQCYFWGMDLHVDTWNFTTLIYFTCMSAFCVQSWLIFSPIKEHFHFYITNKKGLKPFLISPWDGSSVNLNVALLTMGYKLKCNFIIIHHSKQITEQCQPTLFTLVQIWLPEHSKSEFLVILNVLWRDILRCACVWLFRTRVEQVRHCFNWNNNMTSEYIMVILYIDHVSAQFLS